MKTSLEDQQAWFTTQLRTLKAELNIDIDCVLYHGQPGFCVHLSEAPHVNAADLDARLEAITAEGNRLFSP